MKKNYSRIGALALSFAMAIPMAVPAMAASDVHWIVAAMDNTPIFSSSYTTGTTVGEIELVDDLGIGVDVEVSVNGTVVSTSRPVAATGVLDNGTVYRLAEDDDRSLTLSTTNKVLLDDMDIKIVRTPVEYTVTANSGAQGSNSNLGSSTNPTCQVNTGATTVDGNSLWQGYFQPNEGLMIKAFNIRTSAGGQNIITAGNKTVTVGDTELTIQKSGNDYIISTDQLANDLYITALTVAEATQYQLSVVTVGDVTTDVASQLMTAGETQKIKLTPSAGIIDTIVIEDGSKSATLTTGKTSVTVNGHTYRVSWNAYGQATISVPAISADVTITATCTNKAVLAINAPSNIICNYDELTYHEVGDPVTVRISGGDYTEVDSVTISSATDEVTLSGNEYRFTLDGITYRVDTLASGNRVIYFTAYPGNIVIDVNSNETRHTITLDHDANSEYEGTREEIVVLDGDSQTVTFRALDADDQIERLVFTVNGRKITAARGDDYVVIDGTRQYITWTNGKAEVDLQNVQSSMTIKSYTTAYDGDYQISVDSDAGATTTSDYVYADYGTSKTITFTEKSKYTIEEIRVTVNGKTYTAERGDNYLTVNGQRCSLSWGSSKSSITLSNIKADMDVYCVTDYNDAATSDYTVTLVNDRGSYYVGSGELGVDSGDSQEVTFYAESGAELQRLEVVYKGTTYKVRPSNTYVTINGTRCPVEWDDQDSVTINLKNIKGNVTVTAVSDQTAASKTVTLNPGAHVGIGLSTGSESIDVNEPVTVTVVPDSGYYIDSVIFSFDSSNDKATLSRSSTTFALAGQTYAVTRNSDGSLSVKFDAVPANMTVTATAAQEEVVVPTTPAETTTPETTSTPTTRAYIEGVGDGQFAPDRTVTRAEALTMLLRATQSISADSLIGMVDAPYLDVTDTAWYAGYVMIGYNRGYLTNLNGTTSAVFNPNEPITRAQFVELAARMFGMVSVGPAATPFEDVLPGYWASSYIAQAAGSGWINGYADGLFHPDDTLTRAELVAIINRATGRALDPTYVNANINQLNTFTDVGPSHWAYYEILAAANVTPAASVAAWG